MMTAYRIKDVAERSGFSTAALRYYEDIGLLPEASRSAKGYRLYDERTLERLAFISRAKQLGCSLDEIADLATAWEGGECGPIQDRLRAVVAEKTADARRRVAELMTLIGELREAAAALERHRPQGPCDEQCGCVSEPSADATRRSSVSLMPKPLDVGTPAPIACTLSAASVDTRLAEWQALLAHADRHVDIEGGVRVQFANRQVIGELARLAAAEQDCCRFLDLAITIDDRGLALEVRAPDEALPMLLGLVGGPL